MVSQNTVLMGEYELTIDEKGRFFVPAEIRKALKPERDGEAFVVVIGINEKPWFYPEVGYESMVSKRESQLSPSEDRLAFDQLNFSMASKAEWDAQWRVNIPPQIRKNTELGREVTVIGVRDHLECWNRDDWNVRKEQLKAQRAALAAKQREAEEKNR